MQLLIRICTWWSKYNVRMVCGCVFIGQCKGCSEELPFILISITILHGCIVTCLYCMLFRATNQLQFQTNASYIWLYIFARNTQHHWARSDFRSSDIRSRFDNTNITGCSPCAYSDKKTTWINKRHFQCSEILVARYIVLKVHLL